MTNNGATPKKRYRLFRTIGYLFLSLAFLLAFYGLVVGLAINNGNSRRVATELTTQATQLSRQMELAQDDYAKGNYQLTLTRLEWILAQAPDYPGAAALQQQTKTQVEQTNITPTPTHTVTPSPTPTEIPTVVAIADPAQELNTLRQLLEEEAWQEAVTQIINFQTQLPNYEREKTDLLLYEAYIGLGLALIYGEQVELGIFYLEQGETLGNLSLEVQDQRGWAELYVTGIAFYQVNWEVSVYYFRQLCAAALFFHDACSKFYTSLLANGEQFAAAQDWCPAEVAYREALDYGNTQTLRDKLNTAIEGCLQATPTPSAPITGTLPITNTIP